jgi:hypothetical protein
MSLQFMRYSTWSKSNFTMRLHWFAKGICINQVIFISDSGQWIQVAALNRLRRSDPLQWRDCRTCLKRIDYTPLYQYGGVRGNIISFALDNIRLIRAIAGVLLTIVVRAFTTSFIHTISSKNARYHRCCQWDTFSTDSSQPRRYGRR